MIESIQPLQAEKFSSCLKVILSKTNVDDTFIEVRDLQRMDKAQKADKSELLLNVKKNFRKIDKENPQSNQENDHAESKDVLLNLNLESMVTIGHQEKLKRDRIGIIFRDAKKRAWDSRRKRTQE